MLFNRLKSLIYVMAAACALVAAQAPVRAAGTLPLAMTNQLDSTGAPAAGCLVYLYVAGTISQKQDNFADFGLTQKQSNPLQCDQSGRVPMFWLADGLIHVVLTTASGGPLVDTTMQVLGPSSGGGGGGSTVDPTTIAQTGDSIFRFDSIPRPGWVFENGQTIGSAISGASQRANADTQNLFIYLWTICPQTKCPVGGGRGATALADFNANKTIATPDMRANTPVGRDCMGATCAGRILASNVSSGGGDGVDTPLAFGGLANYAQSISVLQTNLPALNFPVTDPGHSHTVNISAPSGIFPAGLAAGGISQNWWVGLSGSGIAGAGTAAPTTTGISVASGGSGVPLSIATPLMNPFVLGSWLMKL